MEIIKEILKENSYLIIVVGVVLFLMIVTGTLKLLDLIDRIKKKIKEAEK